MTIPKPLYETLSKIKFLVSIKKQGDQIERHILRQKQIARRVERRTVPHPMMHSYKFCILCVKRPRYVDMAIEQINSLAFHNPYHVFDIICDDICLSYFIKNKYKLDYPEQVVGVRLVKKATKPWQIYKIQTLVYAMKWDAIVVDADMYWFSEPRIYQWQALLYTKAYDIKDQSREVKLVKHLFHHSEWKEFSHYVSALVYVPYPLYSVRLEKKLLEFTQMILNSSHEYIRSPENRDMISRLAEEIAINLAFQSEFRPDQITVLKKFDSPGDKSIVQALYYGAMNQIMS